MLIISCRRAAKRPRKKDADGRWNLRIYRSNLLMTSSHSPAIVPNECQRCTARSGTVSRFLLNSSSAFSRVSGFWRRLMKLMTSWNDVEWEQMDFERLKIRIDGGNGAFMMNYHFSRQLQTNLHSNNTILLHFFDFYFHLPYPFFLFLFFFCADFEKVFFFFSVSNFGGWFEFFTAQ